MNIQATLLLQLQKLDMALAKQLARLKEIATALGDNHLIVEAQAQLTKAESALKPWTVKVRDLELEDKSIAAKSKEVSDMLYSGRIRNTKQMADMQDEIAALGRRQAQIEETLFDAMIHVEDGQKQVAEAQVALKQITDSQKTAQAALVGEQEFLKADVKKQEEARTKFAQTIDPAALQRYESLRVSKRGQPVSQLQGESCSLCGVEQTGNIIHQYRQGHELAICLSCGRILA